MGSCRFPAIRRGRRWINWADDSTPMVNRNARRAIKACQGEPMLWSVLISVGLFVGLLGGLEVGRRIGRGVRRGKDSAGSGRGDGVVLGVFGLIVAFTFSASASRFNEGGGLIVEQANARGRGALRVGALDRADRPPIRRPM